MTQQEAKTLMPGDKIICILGGNGGKLVQGTTYTVAGTDYDGDIVLKEFGNLDIFSYTCFSKPGSGGTFLILD